MGKVLYKMTEAFPAQCSVHYTPDNIQRNGLIIWQPVRRREGGGCGVYPFNADICISNTDISINTYICIL